MSPPLWMPRNPKPRCEQLEVETPDGTAFGLQPAGFQGALDGGVAGMDLTAEPMDVSVAPPHDQSVQERSSHTGASRGRLDEHFHQLHCFTTEFRAPFV